MLLRLAKKPALRSPSYCLKVACALQGDSVEILTITKQGVQRELLDLKKD